VSRPECERCHGARWILPADADRAVPCPECRCSACGGSGTVDGFDAYEGYTFDCPVCDGTGREPEPEPARPTFRVRDTIPVGFPDELPTEPTIGFLEDEDDALAATGSGT
jgi:hypothetical protein